MKAQALACHIIIARTRRRADFGFVNAPAASIRTKPHVFSQSVGAASESMPSLRPIFPAASTLPDSGMLENNLRRRLANPHSNHTRAASDRIMKSGNRIHLSLAPELAEKLRAFPGQSWNDKIKSILSHAAGFPARAPELKPVSSPSTPLSPSNGVEAGPDTAFESLGDDCEVMDLGNRRCLRKAPERIFKIDAKICAACQFMGKHYPAKAGGNTPSELDRRELKRRMMDELFDLEKIKDDRRPVTIL